jgi:hypothetical protein
MPTISLPGFVGPAYQGQSYMQDSERLINWYPESSGSPTAPAPSALLPCPGFQTVATVSQAPIRGMFFQRNRAFFVAGFAFYELFYNVGTNVWTTTQRGTVAADSNPVTIHANGDAGDQLWITSGGVGYIYDLIGNTLTVAGPAGTVVSMGDFLSARFLSLDSTTGAFYASDRYNGLVWNPLFVAQSESGDPWRTLVVTPDNLIRLFGETTGEVWADQGAFPFPFSQVQEGSSPYGIVSPFAFSVDQAVTLVAQNKQGRGLVVRMNGYAPQRVSTHAIETAIQGFTPLNDTISFPYQEFGHSFTILTFPTAQKTFVIDETTGLWGERAYWNGTTGEFLAYRPGCQMEAFNKIIVGDRLTGSIYEMSSLFQSDVDGAVIRRMRQPPRFSVNQRRITINSLEVICDKGQGLVTGQGSNPVLMLDTSRNGGKTFGNERWVGEGAIGAFDTRVRWTRLGQSRNFVPRFTATDPVPHRLVDCLISFTVGLS